MAQRAQIVDITKSYLPGDPNAFVQNLVNTDREDGEEKTFPLMPYEGYNFLPTAYGYKSYFGTNSLFGLNALSARVQHVLLYQLPSYKSRLIALAENGIWVGIGEGTDLRWIQVVTHTFNANVYEEWTWCVIENILYMYKQGTAQVYKTGIGTLTVPAVPAVPAVPGGIVGSPRVLQTIVETLGGAGTETDIWNGNVYSTSFQYFVASAFSTASTNTDLFIVADNSSIEIAITGTPPAGVSNIRVFVLDDDLGTTFYKDYALSAFPISIANFIGFSVGGHQAATLDDGTGTPGIPEVPAYNLTNDLAITSFVPSFLTMSGQMGIFKAGLRLGFWDSANSVSWSSNFDLADLTPSIETMAGNTIFGSVVGRIVTCKGHGEGFIVYSTRSVVGVTFSSSGNLLWDGKKIFDNTGISYSKAVTSGKTDSEHFFFGTSGIYTIGKFNTLAGKYEGEAILPEVYDYLKESRDPVYMTVLQDRYLCFSLINSDYIYGRQSFYTGTANPYLAVIDWYIPSNDYPTATYNLLPAQMWEIIRTEMSGQHPTKRKDGEWVPKYTTTVDRMDSRYYSWWLQYIQESTGLVSYETYSTFLDSLPIDLTLSDMNTYLQPQRPTSPPDAYRYGRLRTSTGIRSMWGLAGGHVWENNESLIWAQENEWDAFIRHQVANKNRLLSLIDETLTITTPTVVITLTSTGSTLLNAIGDSISVNWQRKVGAVIVESGTAAITSVLLSSIYPDGGYTASDGYFTFSNWPEGLLVTGNYANLIAYIAGGSLYPRHDGHVATHGYTSYYPTLSDRSDSPPNFTAPPTVVSAPSTGTTAVIGTLVTGEGNNEWLVTEGPSEKAAKEVILRRTFNKGFEISVTPVTVVTTVYTATATNILATQTSSIIKEYASVDVTGQYGYSQFRALVTHWDRIRFGLYGNYEILETVPAEAMTAKVWQGTYPTDKGTGRNQIWSYSEYKAQAITDLSAGTIGAVTPFSSDPNATPNLIIDGYDTEGITSAHSEFTLPGATFLLQTGSIEASYPTFVGSLVYDMHLKKWGKYKGNHKLLIETVPINSANFGTITYSDLGANAGIFDASGNIYLFDSVPGDSWLRWGKAGYYRLGMTNLLEVKASMRYPSNFRIITESSLDGKNVDASLVTVGSYTNEVVAEHLPDISARWHTVKISGNYDLTGLEVRAILSGRR